MLHVIELNDNEVVMQMHCVIPVASVDSKEA